MKKILSISKLLLLLPVLVTMTVSCTSDSKKTVAGQLYEKTKENLRQTEEKNPANFLIVAGHDKRNIFGQTVIKATITNKASVAIFKDIDIKLSFFSKTKALLETDKETVFEVLHPGETKDFKTKYFAPKGTDSVSLAVLSAKDRKS